MVSVLVVTQSSGLLIGLVLVAVLGADSLPASDLALAFLGGASGMAALSAFYTALATGTMSVVAPIAAMGVVVPVAAGLAQGETPAALQVFGLPLAILGVVVLSYEEQEEGSNVGRTSILLALLAALGFGAYFTLLDAASTADKPGWAVVAARSGGVTLALLAAAATRPSFRGVAGSLGVLVAIGAFDIAANWLFAVSSTLGVLPVVAVGGSMYPVFTIALAQIVLGERLKLPQKVGVALALSGVVLIAAGS